MKDKRKKNERFSRVKRGGNVLYFASTVSFGCYKFMKLYRTPPKMWGEREREREVTNYGLNRRA